MDTLFRLVSLQSSSSDQQHHQQSSFTSSRTSSSSRSTKTHHPYPYPQTQEAAHQDQECYNNITTYPHHHLYMDEDFSSSSSSKQFSTPPPQPLFSPADFSIPQNLNLNLEFCSSSSSSSSSQPQPRWASDLLLQCARAIAHRDTHRVQHLMWMLNELASAYGDTEQKLASYFLHGLFARLTDSGPRTLLTLSTAADRTSSFDSTRRLALRFQDLSPWHSFAHVAANGAILESFLDATTPPPHHLHILDLSNTFCTQWPTLLEALATRSADDTPHLSITTVVSTPSHRVMKEVAARMEKFARLMGVPFAFHVVHHAGDLSDLDLATLNLGSSSSSSNAALAVNLVNALRTIPPTGQRRDAFLVALRGLQPRIITIVEEEADLYSDHNNNEEDEEVFIKVFQESMRFFSVYFDSLEECFPRTSNERLALERAAGRAVVDLVACPARESTERRETGEGWARRARAAGMVSVGFSDDVADDVRALLRRYREGWSMRAAEEGLLLTWKEQPVVWASAWRP